MTRITDSVQAVAAGVPPGLLPAREQMALSLGFHIVLACFGVAFPTMIFLMHRRGIVRGDLTALRLAGGGQCLSRRRLSECRRRAGWQYASGRVVAKANPHRRRALGRHRVCGTLSSSS